jgi:hypothetical protein
MPIAPSLTGLPAQAALSIILFQPDRVTVAPHGAAEILAADGRRRDQASLFLNRFLALPAAPAA